MGEETSISGGGRVARDVRCSGCSALLARIDRGGLCIRRGDLEACIDGCFDASLTCYRPRCKRLNVVRLTTGS